MDQGIRLEIVLCPVFILRRELTIELQEVIINILDVNKIVNFIIGRHRRE